MAATKINFSFVMMSTPIARCGTTGTGLPELRACPLFPVFDLVGETVKEVDLIWWTEIRPAWLIAGGGIHYQT
jgi:hypothetical protein